MLSRPTVMLCYTRSTSCYTNTVFQSFFVGLHRIANVLNFEYWHLFIACKNWLCGYETWMKNTFFCSQFSPQDTGYHILGFWNSKMFGRSMPPRSPWKKGANGPLLIQSVTRLKLAGYFNYHWNPYMLKCSQSENDPREDAEKMGQEPGMQERSASLTKHVQTRWLDIDQVLSLYILWTGNVDKTAKESEVNVQPSRTGKLGWLL